MISLLYLNKLIYFIIFFTVVIFNCAFAEDEPIDIWENKEIQNEENVQNSDEKNLTIESPILSEDINKITIQIKENKIEDEDRSVIGIFDPEENNFDLNMWSSTDGVEIKKTLTRINKLKLSKLSEDLLFQVLFTNAYAPQKNLDSKEFLQIKINWLIKKKRINDLVTLLKTNSEVGQNSTAVKFLVNEYLSSADIKSACDKVNLAGSKIQNNYLEKFMIYCLINDNRKEEAQLVFDLLKENGFKDNFLEDKINYLLGISDKTTKIIVDNDLLNFYF